MLWFSYFLLLSMLFITIKKKKKQQNKQTNPGQSVVFHTAIMTDTIKITLLVFFNNLKTVRIVMLKLAIVSLR